MGRVAKLKLQYFGHITRGSAGQLALTVLVGIMEGLRYQGRPRRQWIHDTEEWTGCDYIQLKEMSQDRAQWRRKISEWSSTVANPHRGRSTSEWASDHFISEMIQGSASGSARIFFSGGRSLSPSLTPPLPFPLSLPSFPFLSFFHPPCPLPLPFPPLP